MKNSSKIGHDITLLVVSFDSYNDLWDPFFHCLFKYWPDCPYPVYLGSNSLSYNDVRVNSILIGEDKDYSTNLLNMLLKIETQWVLLWIEDLFLKSKINNDYLNNIIEKAIKKNVGYLKLASNFPWSYTTNNKQLIGVLPKGVKYRAGIGLALWNKNTLIELLVPGENAWEIERNGSLRSNKILREFYALTTFTVDKKPINFINSVIKGEWNLEVISFLKNEGFESIIKGRKKQSILNFVYIKIYLFRLYLFRKFKKYWY